MTRRLRILGFAALAGLALFALVKLDTGERAAAPPSFLGHNREFSAFSPPRPLPAGAAAVAEADGTQMRLADFAGNVVLLNFWATWCVPCVREMPALERLAARGHDGLAVVAVSVDMKGAEVVAPFAAKHELGHIRLLYDPMAGAMRSMGVSGLPATFILDKRGRIAGRLEGAADWDSPEAEELLRFYLDAPEGDAPEGDTKKKARERDTKKKAAEGDTRKKD